jgi:hypothetical protein
MLRACPEVRSEYQRPLYEGETTRYGATVE